MPSLPLKDIHSILNDQAVIAVLQPVVIQNLACHILLPKGIP